MVLCRTANIWYNIKKENQEGILWQQIMKLPASWAKFRAAG